MFLTEPVPWPRALSNSLLSEQLSLGRPWHRFSPFTFKWKVSDEKMHIYAEINPHHSTAYLMKLFLRCVGASDIVLLDNEIWPSRLCFEIIALQD